jgi:hypothetical protein
MSPRQRDCRDPLISVSSSHLRLDSPVWGAATQLLVLRSGSIHPKARQDIGRLMTGLPTPCFPIAFSNPLSCFVSSTSYNVSCMSTGFYHVSPMVDPTSHTFVLRLVPCPPRLCLFKVMVVVLLITPSLSPAFCPLFSSSSSHPPDLRCISLFSLVPSPVLFLVAILQSLRRLPHSYFSSSPSSSSPLSVLLFHSASALPPSPRHRLLLVPILHHRHAV